MTLCELMHKVEWADLTPYIERHLPERPEIKLAADDRVDAYLRRLYDTLQNGSHPDESDYFDKASRNSHEENIKNKSAFNSVPSGFMALDRVTMGWQPSDLIIIAARPSMGKTTFALSMTRNITIDYNKPVGYFSLGMSAQQLEKWLLVAESGLDSRDLRNGQLTPDQRKHLEISPLANTPLFIDDTPALSITEFRSKVEKLKTQHDMIVIDYLQLMNLGCHDNKRNREQEVAAILCSLKAVAKEFDLPIIVLSNVYRSLSTADKRPKLSGLDYLKAIDIEQNVDLVIFIHRPEYYGMTVDENGMDIAGVTELIIAKHRNGDVTDIKLRFLKDLMRFTEIDGSDQLPDRCTATTLV